jgi:tRNA 2-selenouridine synthase
VLDLEVLAAHRGSVLGDLPHVPQPTQKMFESRVWAALRGFDRKRPVYVEAESRKIGSLRVPEALIQAMWAADCILLEAPDAARVEVLKREYAHFFEQTEVLARQLECLLPLHGHAIIARWKELAAARRWDKLIVELLVRHYDPAYTRSSGKHYAELPHALKLALESVDDAAFATLARRCLETERASV